MQVDEIKHRPGDSKREELKTANNEPNLANSRNERDKLKRMKSSTDVDEPERENENAVNNAPISRILVAKGMSLSDWNQVLRRRTKAENSKDGQWRTQSREFPRRKRWARMNKVKNWR